LGTCGLNFWGEWSAVVCALAVPSAQKYSFLHLQGLPLSGLQKEWQSKSGNSRWQASVLVRKDTSTLSNPDVQE
jgi:hypothetical protein